MSATSQVKSSRLRPTARDCDANAKEPHFSFISSSKHLRKRLGKKALKYSSASASASAFGIGFDLAYGPDFAPGIDEYPRIESCGDLEKLDYDGKSAKRNLRKQHSLGSLSNMATVADDGSGLTMSNPKSVFERRDSSTANAKAKASTPTGGSPKSAAAAQSTAADDAINLYTVGDHDTLERVAAQFDSTPTAIMRLNRLSTRMIFPGQKLKVPDASGATSVQPPSSASRSPAPGATKTANNTGNRSSIASVTSASAVSSSSSVADPLIPDELDERTQRIEEERFVKLEAKRITRDHGVVSGTFLVTPNVVMFDPNVSDKLVLEYGMERFGALAQFDSVRCVSLHSSPPSFGSTTDSSFSDADQRSSTSTQGNTVSENAGKTRQDEQGKLVEVDSASTEAEAEAEKSSATTPVKEAVDAKTDGIDSPSENDRKDDVQSTVTKQLGTSPDEMIAQSTGVPVKLQNAITDSFAERTNTLLSNVDELLRVTASRSRQPLESQVQYLCISTTIASCASINTKKTEVHITELSCSEEDVDYWFAVPKSRVDDLYSFFNYWMLRTPHLSGEKDKEKEKDRAAGAGSDADSAKKSKRGLVGALLDRKSLLPRFGRGGQATSSGTNATSASPSPSSLANTSSSSQSQSDTDAMPDGRQSPTSNAAAASKPTRRSACDDDFFKDWEIINVNARARHVSCPGATPMIKSTPATPTTTDGKFELLDSTGAVRTVPSANALQVIELIDPSSILTSEHIAALSRHIPPWTQGYAWSLTYSTETNGFSLRTLYRRQATEVGRTRTPNILVLTDTEGHQFGAFCSDHLWPAEHFFGTGECFVFTFTPEFRVFHWTGENNYFIKCSDQSLAIGSSHGHNALWLDQELNHGRTQCCETFENEPLTGDSKQDFVIKVLEVWAIHEE